MDEIYDDDELYDDEELVAERRPTWSERLDDFMTYMGKATVIKTGLMFAILIPLILHQRAREEDRKAQQARGQLDQQIQEVEQVMRERVLSGNASDVDLMLLRIPPEEYELMRGPQLPPEGEAGIDPPPATPDF